MPNQISLANLLDAKIRLVNGETVFSVAKDLKVSSGYLKNRLDKMDQVYTSKLPVLQMDKEIIQESIMERLKPIREELSGISLDIIRQTDSMLAEKLSKDNDKITPKDLAIISEKYSTRLSRLTGIDVDPTVGQPKVKSMSPTIVNMFGRFLSDKVINRYSKQEPVEVKAEVIPTTTPKETAKKA